jgi:hypothetical protein
MADNRTPRELENRDTSTRVKQWAPASLLPEIQQQSGWKYRWIRTTMAGEADARNVSARMREGWEPVLLADHPELQLFVDPNSRFKDNVEVGGLLLCKTPEEFVAQRDSYYNNQAQAQAEAVDNSFMKENDARMPLFKEKRTTTSFGKGNN